MLRSPDRRLAALAAMLGAVAILAVNAVAGDADSRSRSGPLPAAPRAQQRAQRELTRLLELGGSTRSWAQYAFHRTTPAGPLEVEIVDVNRPPDHLEAAFGGLSGTLDGRAIQCSSGPGGPVCSTSLRADSASRAPGIQGLREATDAARRWYTVERGPDETILGERVRCFRVAATGLQPRDLYGTATEWCLAADGVILRSVVRRSDSSDTSTAVRVRRRVDDADLSALLEPFDVARGRGDTR